MIQPKCWLCTDRCIGVALSELLATHWWTSFWDRIHYHIQNSTAKCTVNYILNKNNSETFHTCIVAWKSYLAKHGFVSLSYLNPLGITSFNNNVNKCLLISSWGKKYANICLKGYNAKGNCSNNHRVDSNGLYLRKENSFFHVRVVCFSFSANI